ncbi:MULTISPECIES: LysE family translocator [unclassified Brevibacterium]|uniref:LysE family translocator n=1 Tax=unclassified Brevibacterium TaxID=2614124 RepID=UPI001586B69C|nr:MULTISPECIES: LysE family translocator [Actinomycetes]MCK1801921.1 LysE family translocator [Brevibacterium sp. R8603A2]MCX0276509.1 LysE family translocator [Nocardia zapadnayensis]
MTGAEFIAFLGAALILAVTPGPDTFLTIRYGAQSFRRGIVYASAAACGITVWAILALSGIAALLQSHPTARTVLAVCGGIYLTFLGVRTLWGVWTAERALRSRTASVRAVLVAAGGAGAQETAAAPGAPASAPALVPVTTSGEVHAGIAAPDGEVILDPTDPSVETATSGRGVDRRRSPFPVGLLSSLTNPKTGMFFLALFPAFLPSEQGIGLIAVLVLTIVAVFALYSLLLVATAAGLGRRLEGRRGALAMDLVSGGVLVLLGLSIPFL